MKRKIEFYDVFFIIILAVYMFYAATYAQHTPLEFDESYNAQISVNMENKGLYATTYNNDKLFDPWITTGPTVIFPTALFIKAFGISRLSVRATNIIYLFLMLQITYLIISKKVNKASAIACCLAMMSYPLKYSTRLLGEVPSLALLLCGYNLIKEDIGKNNKRDFIIGLLFGLAIITKLIVIFALIGCISAIILDSILSWKKRNLVFITLGIFTPNLLFELYKISVLGVNNYSILIKEIYATSQANLGVDNTKLDTMYKFFLTAKDANIHYYFIILVFIFLAVLFICITYRIIKHESYDTACFAMMLSSILFFMYWIIINNKLWPRRFLNYYYLIPVVMILGFNEIHKYFYFKKKYLINIAAFLLSINFLNSFPIEDYMKYELQFQAENSIVQYIKRIKEPKTLYGHGWWQAPGISLLSGERIYDLYSDRNLEIGSKLGGMSILVVDDTEHYFGPGGPADIFASYNTRLLKQEGNNFLYYIKKK